MPPEPTAISASPRNRPCSVEPVSATAACPTQYTSDSQKMVRYFPNSRSESSAPIIGKA